MKLIVNPHKIEILKEPVNEREIDITKCEFEFADEITNEYVKEAYFTFKGTSYKVIIVNNECQIPSEVLVEKGQVEIGVVAFLIESGEEIKRYNPSPAYFNTWDGSLKDNAENSEPITPSEMEQYEQALNDGLETLDNALDDLQEKVDSGYFDGQDGRDGVDGTNGITPTIGNNGNWYLGDEDTGKPSRGEQGIPGEPGATGQPGRDGTNGVDGISPTVSTSKSGTTTTIEITDKNGTHTATINDGINGTNGTNGRDGYVQYTAGDNITIENNVISATGGDLSNYYTKSEIDANKMPTYTFELDEGQFVGTGISHLFTVDEKTRLAIIFNDAYQKQYESINILVKYRTGNNSSYKTSQFLCTPGPQNVYPITSQPTSYIMTSPLQTPYYVSNENTKYYNTFIQALSISLTWSNNQCTVSGQISASFIILPTNKYFEDYLAKNNTKSYTPTANYHPATKKYVDDSIASAITDALGGNY